MVRIAIHAAHGAGAADRLSPNLLLQGSDNTVDDGLVGAAFYRCGEP